MNTAAPAYDMDVVTTNARDIVAGLRCGAAIALTGTDSAFVR